MKKTIVVIDRFPSEFISQLNTLGQDLIYAPECSFPEALELLKQAEILILNSKISLDGSSLSQASSLKLVCRAGVGMDHFDLPLLKRMRVEVFNTPGANSIPVAEQTVGLLLNLMHNISKSNHEVKKFQWLREPNRGNELSRKKVGLIGYGNTGRSVAKCLSGFGCHILAFDKYQNGFSDSYVQEAGMEEIYEQAEILTLHVPLTSDTHKLVTETYLNKFIHPIWLLNLARGPVVDLKDLVVALKTGKVLGAGLDVLENEKFETLSHDEKELYSELFEQQNVILTPHTGGWSHQSLQRINNMIYEKVKSFLR